MTSPLSPEAVAQMVAELRAADKPLIQSGPFTQTRERLRKAADMITTLAAENATLRQHNDIRGQNMRDTWEAMQAMRDAINDHIPLPSTESDLLQGPENSVFCEVVATAVIGALATLRASEAAALDRVKVLEAGLADPVSVHANMLRGAIAMPSFANTKHLYAAEFAALTPTADKEPKT